MSLTKTDRKTKEWKADLFSKLRVAIDQYDYVHFQNPLKPSVEIISARISRLGFTGLCRIVVVVLCCRRVDVLSGLEADL